MQDRLTVVVLGTGRLGETHIAALAHLRDSGLTVDEQRRPAGTGRCGQDRRLR